MYYLVIKNLGTEKCIDRNVDDIYEDGQYYSWLPDFSFARDTMVRCITIKCIEIPGPVFNAVIYSD